MLIIISTINPRVGRGQYLVTYSQIDESKFFTRGSFRKMLEAQFNEKPVFLKWTIGLASEMAVSQNRIAEKHGIQVNFSDKHNFYLSTYRYVCKSE